MRLERQGVLRALVICGIATTLAFAAASPPYDFTGHWAGTAASRGVTVPLSVDFVSTTNPRRFTGQATLEDPVNPSTCQLKAKYTRKLKLNLHCNDGTRPKVTAQLDPTTLTLTGSFAAVGRHGNRHVVTFTLTKTSA